MKGLLVFSAFLLVLLLLANYALAVDWESKRTKMIDMDLTVRGIWNPAVLKAMKQVPRHKVVPQQIRKLAYADRPLPIGEGQTISQFANLLRYKFMARYLFHRLEYGRVPDSTHCEVHVNHLGPF
jgi:hypothetical protein